CTLVSHTTSCCGSVLMMAINSSAVAQFSSQETYCDSLLPKCGCASFGTSAEDGTLTNDTSRIVADCTNGTCNSRYNGVPCACADKLCTDEQYCTIYTGGPPGPPTGNCTFRYNCSDCSCISTAASCTCAVQNGFITVSCAAP